MRLLPALCPAAHCLDRHLLFPWMGHEEEVAEPGSALRVVKLVENVELFQMVKSCGNHSDCISTEVEVRSCLAVGKVLEFPSHNGETTILISSLI